MDGMQDTELESGKPTSEKICLTPAPYQSKAHIHPRLSSDMGEKNTILLLKRVWESSQPERPTRDASHGKTFARLSMLA